MVAIDIGGVGLGEGIAGVTLQVLDPEVAGLVPDVELAVVTQGVEYVTSVGTDAGHGAALVERVAGNLHTGRTELPGSLVEGDGHEVVIYAVVMLQQGRSLEGIGYFHEAGFVGSAEIEGLAVGRPAGEGLQILGGAQDVLDLVLLGIIEKEVAGLIDDLNLLLTVDMEGLTGLVGGEGYPGMFGMPAGIDACGKDGRVLDLYLAGLVSLHEDGSSVVGTYVEEHLLRTVVLVVVAVDAVIVL